MTLFNLYIVYKNNKVLMISKFKDTIVYRAESDYFRSTHHEFDSYINFGKQEFIDEFIMEYRRVMLLCFNELYNKVYTWEVKGRKLSLHLKRRSFPDGIPTFFNVSKFNSLKNYKGLLSGRMVSNVLKQLSSILRAELKSSIALDHRFEIPSLANINPEIPPKFIKILDNNNENSIFKNYVMLTNFTKKRNENIYVPIKTHKRDTYYTERGEIIGSIMLSSNKIDYRYEMSGVKKDDKIKVEKVLGADMGQNKICCLSDGQQTNKENKQGKTFKQLEDKIKNKVFNSNSYRRSVVEMKCFTREVMNRLEISDVTELRLESNKGIKENTKNNRKYWQTEIVNQKLKFKCQDNHVDFVLTLSPYKSQRCNKCGFTHKNNRNKEKFVCLNCFHEDDADNNAALNNSLELPYNNLWSFAKLNKINGFFWLANGLIAK